VSFSTDTFSTFSSFPFLVFSFSAGVHSAIITYSRFRVSGIGTFPLGSLFLGLLNVTSLVLTVGPCQVLQVLVTSQTFLRPPYHCSSCSSLSRRVISRPQSFSSPTLNHSTRPGPPLPRRFFSPGFLSPNFPTVFSWRRNSSTIYQELGFLFSPASSHGGLECFVPAVDAPSLLARIFLFLATVFS